ncbi:hypothetical protein [Acaryochloris sp. 'Moss Beach']|uniref:hypothetical protein n=1 Tax=Acaryochloris sp. 'Moss Beach' TaxID=2740837 RepID=UPI001F36E38D|nr:hypothetical protein [Acaryochloris sp. 'Moss Beach']
MKPTAIVLGFQWLETLLWGAAAAAGLSTVIGDRTITAEKVLAGAASGATIGGVIDPAVDEVVVIDPQTDLNLILEKPFNLS